VSPRARIRLLVGVLALVAAGLVVGITLATRTSPPPAVTAKPQPGAPPLLIDLGVRTDTQAVALRRALTLYGSGRRQAAGAIFVRYDSLDAQVGAALADWPGGLDTLLDLATTHPQSGLAQLELGLALFWKGRVAEAQAAWQTAKRVQPDTSYAIHAADLLHPRDVPGLPYIVPTFALPRSLDGTPTAAEVAAAAARAKSGGARDKIVYGLVLRALGHAVSAEKQFRAAAALAPRDVDARVAAAVGLFDKDKPSLAFSKLGPLVRIFPKAVSVRFHLGLMLLWIDDVADGKKQLQRVIAAGTSAYSSSARQLLTSLGK
jgi:tetratricopeptide (TPR) repeat protein